MDTIRQDLRYALRSLRTAPGFAAVAIATLALGIGANTTVFSTIDALLLRAIPSPHADRLVALSHGGDGPVAPATFEAWREQADIFDELTAYAWLNASLEGGETAERIQGYRVLANFFATMGVEPAIGRAFAEGEDRPGEDLVVLLSHGFWEQRFAADSGAVGRTLTLDGEPHTIIGVMPPGLSYPPGAAVWTPLAYNVASSGRYLEVIGRLAPGASLDQAQAAMAAIAGRLERAAPDSRLGDAVTVRRLGEYQTRYVRPLLLVLLAAVGFVLLIACANIANLLLARATSRTSEIAVRRALGASRGRILRQLLTESVVLALVGGGIGALLGVWGIEIFRGATPAETARLVAGWDQLGLDPRVLGFTLAVAAAAGIGFGLAPAFGASRADLTHAMKGVARVTGGGWTGWGRAGLVVAQVALAVVLLAGAGLMVRSFTGLLRADPGFRADGVLTMQLVVPRTGTSDQDAIAFYDRLLEEVRALPAVSGAGVVSHLPFSGMGGGASYRLQETPADPGDEPFAQYRRASPGYLDALGVPLLRGRTFSDRDDPGAPAVALVSRALADRHWPGGDPVGRQIEMYGTGREIVGVVGDVHHWGAADGPRATVYVPHRQDPSTTSFLTVRAASDPGALAPAVRRLVGATDPRVAVAEVKTMDRLMAEFHAADRLMAGMLAVFAAIALLIAAVGIYGVLAYTVARRTREIGLRTALGADPHRLRRWVLRRGLTLVGLGLGIGLLATLGVTRFMAAILYGVRPADPVTLAAVVLVLGASALLATWVPARRATRVDPMVALREE